VSALVAGDPRGPFRTVAAVEATPQVYRVTFAECGHVGLKTRHFAAPVSGERVRCHDCRDLRTAVAPGGRTDGTSPRVHVYATAERTLCGRPVRSSWDTDRPPWSVWTERNPSARCERCVAAVWR
jgi:hypothetical protein